MVIERVKSQLAVGFVLLLAAIIFLSINTRQAAALVICVDKNNSTSIIPCSDQNAIFKPSDGTPPDYAGYGAVIAGLAAVGTIIWGIYQYRKGLVIQRQQVLFNHISDLNSCKELDDAKKLLGYGRVRKIKAKDEAKVQYYTIEELELEFLKDPEKPKG